MSGNRKKKAVSYGYPDASEQSEPIAKRTRNAHKRVIRRGGNEYLDMLNEDCWREILDYVDLAEVVWSECVSKRWQQIVHRYLQGARLYLRIEEVTRDVFAITTTRDWHVPVVTCRDLAICSEYHVGVIEKYGSAVAAADCVDGRILTALGQHSSDLEDLRVIDPQYLRLKRGDSFNKLRRVEFQNVIMFTDRQITKFLSPTLEDLTIIHNLKMTGECLQLTNLRSLTLKYCSALKMRHLLSAPFADLTKLELQGNSTNTFKDSWRIIKGTPNLEYLGLLSFPEGETEELTEAICALTRLKHLNLEKNMNVNDDLLESVSMHCGKLRTVNIGFCKHVSSTGVVALCRATAKTLTALKVSGSDNVTEDDMAYLISICPKLEFLDLRQCERVSSARLFGVAAALREGAGGAAAIASAARAAAGADAPRLRLAVSRGILEVLVGNRCIFVEQPVKTYDNLIMEFRDVDRKWEDYVKKCQRKK